MNSYRKCVDTLKEQLIDETKGKLLLARTDLWQATRQPGRIAAQRLVSNGIRLAEENKTCQPLIEDVRKDLFGILKSGQQLQPIDAKDAHLQKYEWLLLVTEAETAIASSRIIFNQTMYKLLSYESTLQLKLTTDAIVKMNEQRLEELTAQLTQFQVGCAQMQSYIEIDLETKPHLHFSELPSILENLQTLEHVDVPFDPSQQ